MNEFVTIDEVAELAGESRRDIQMAIMHGKLKQARLDVYAIDKDSAREVWKESGGGSIVWPDTEHWTVEDLATCWDVPRELVSGRLERDGRSSLGNEARLTIERVTVTRISRTDAESYANRTRWMTLDDAADYAAIDSKRLRLLVLTDAVTHEIRDGKPMVPRRALDAYLEDGAPEPDTSELVALVPMSQHCRDSIGIKQRTPWCFLDRPDQADNDHAVTLADVDAALEGRNRYEIAHYVKTFGLHAGKFKDPQQARAEDVAACLMQWREAVDLPGDSKGVLDRLKKAFSKAS